MRRVPINLILGARPAAAVALAGTSATLLGCTALLAAWAPAAAAAVRSNDLHARGAAKRGSSPTEHKLAASLTIELAPAEKTLPATQTITLYVPSSVHAAGAKLPACNPTRLQAEGEKGCPKGSQVGTGSSSGYTLGVVEPLKLLLYNGPGGSLLTYVVGLDPVSIQVVVQGVITRPGGNYGQELAFTIPNSLLEPLPEDPAWLLTLNANLSGKVGWLRSSYCPPHGWSEGAKLGYTNGQSLSLSATLACA
jgi:hypothetical protein